MKVLLTGATGFIGRRLGQRLTEVQGVDLRNAVRHERSSLHGDQVVISGVDNNTDWSSALDRRDTVIHAAARAHIAKDEVAEAMGAYRKVNVDGTLNLAHQASKAGVRRFIFISSIGVNGNVSERPFVEDDQPNPAEMYAQSKREAEEGLWQLQEQSEMEVVIIRPPLVYGPNAPGNFGNLVRWVSHGLPLPLGAIHNKRTLVALDNLVDFVITCIYHPAAANQLFLAGDGQDISTTELIHGVGQAMGKPARLISVPAGMLMFGASLLGKKAVAQRLLGSLQVDISKSRTLLGWEPPVSLEEGLRRCFISENEY